MELFGVIGWISVPQYILQYLSLPAESPTELLANELLYWWITLGVGCGLYLIGLIFGGFGLMKLAERAGIKHGWMGFLPFANTYLAGKLAGEANLFGSRVKHIGLITTIFEVLFVLLNVFSVVLQMIAISDLNYFTQTAGSAGQIILTPSKEAMTEMGVGWIYTCLYDFVLEIIIYVFSLVMIFLFCALFFAFFRKYYARSPFLMTFLCAVLPARGFVLFAVRNNAPIDYNAFMQRRMQQQQQTYGAPYGTPYGGGYAPPQQPGGSSPPEDPYGGDFGGSAPPEGGTPPDDDPFSDF